MTSTITSALPKLSTHRHLKTAQNGNNFLYSDIKNLFPSGLNSSPQHGVKAKFTGCFRCASGTVPQISI